MSLGFGLQLKHPLLFVVQLKKLLQELAFLSFPLGLSVDDVFEVAHEPMGHHHFVELVVRSFFALTSAVIVAFGSVDVHVLIRVMLVIRVQLSTHVEINL